MDASDIVQETLLEAHEGRRRFRGESPRELLAWLRQILAHNIANAVRDHRRAKRDVELERSLEAGLGESSLKLGAIVAGSEASPSEEVARHEELLRLAEAVESLPEEQRDAVVQRYFQGRTLAAVSETAGCSKYVVTQRLRKAMERLRLDLGDEA